MAERRVLPRRQAHRRQHLHARVEADVENDQGIEPRCPDTLAERRRCVLEMIALRGDLRGPLVTDAAAVPDETFEARAIQIREP